MDVNGPGPEDGDVPRRLLTALVLGLLAVPFATGLSTAEMITEIAGRGVGMDVVRSEISQIGGRVDIVTTRGAGTTFTVRLPVSAREALNI